MVSCGSGTSQNEIAIRNSNSKISSSQISSENSDPIIVGANRIEAYLPLLKDKKVGIVGNQSSVIFKSGGSETEALKFTHLVDSLLALKVQITRVFAPEHGFRGTADAGEVVKDGKDSKTGLPIISLYGNNKKPKPDQIKDLDLIIFDLQDVGARFYTYIGSLHYVMEACAENNIPLIILDRPNPNGHYVDGPILDPEYHSFVGMHPIPVVHGLTLGEYAKMVNGEKWLKNGVQVELKVIKMENYDHEKSYSLPIKPSPNLPNDKAINLYPSLCFFEGTNVNAGRGTANQFQVYGSPFLDQTFYKYSYTPKSNEGAKNPKHLGKICYGEDLTNTPILNKIELKWLIKAYENTSDKSKFFNAFFTKLAGGPELQKQIESGLSTKEISDSWKFGLEEFKLKREKYLLY